MRNFERIGVNLQTELLLAAIDAQPELFDEVTGRQDYPGSAHKDTQTIFLRWCKGLDVNAAFTEIQAFDFPAMGKLREAHELINQTIHRVNAKELGRVLIVSLRPGGVITPHADEGAYADHYERFHIALKSEGCLFECEDEEVEMRVGELWWFNHKAQHKVTNFGSAPRLHMIMDMVAPRFHRERLPHAV